MHLIRAQLRGVVHRHTHRQMYKWTCHRVAFQKWCYSWGRLDGKGAAGWADARGLGGEALHKGLESRDVGGDELCLDVGAFTSLVAMSLGWLTTCCVASRTLAVYLCPRMAGCVSWFGRLLLAEKQLGSSLWLCVFASLLWGLYIQELKKACSRWKRW
jgi:hypothetical protein